jgi:O-antigen ligase
MRIAFLTGGTAVTLLLWDRWRSQESILKLSPEVLVALMLPAWAFVTLPLSEWPGGSAVLLFSMYSKALLIFWLLANVVTSSRRLRFLIMVLVVCSVPLAVTAVKNFATGTFVSEGSATVHRIIGYDAGLTRNPNDLALTLNLIIPLGIGLFLTSRKTSVRVLCLLILGIDVLGVILTFSRAGFLGLATIGIMYFVKLVRRPGPDRSWAIVILLLVILSLPLLPSSYVDRIATVTDIKADPTGSAQERWRDTFAAIRFVMAHPISGAGIGMDMLALNQMRGQLWKQVHNVYLQYAVDLGIPGLLLFLLLFVGVYRAARSSGQRAASMPAIGDLFLLAEGVQVSLTVFAVEAFFHPVAYQFYFYYIAGLALGTRSATDASQNVDESLCPTDGESGVLTAA